jgi:hypothetical protein
MIIIILYLILLAAIHAKVELMTEGKMGWGIKFPCWRINSKLIKLLIGKELTGYHFYMCIMFLLLFHSPLLFIPWSLSLECQLLGLYFWYWIVEDFFWFVESPHYGLRNFKKGRIFWHKRWIGAVPTSYVIGGIIGTILLLLGYASTIR